MNRNNKWRLITVLFVLAWAVYEFYPPTKRPLLDEFERRASSKDTNFTAIVAQAKTLLPANAGNAYKSLQQAIGTNRISGYFPTINVAAEKDPNRAILNRLQRDTAGKIKLGLDLQGGTSFLVSMDTTKLASDTNRTDTAGAKENALSQIGRAHV